MHDEAFDLVVLRLVIENRVMTPRTFGMLSIAHLALDLLLPRRAIAIFVVLVILVMVVVGAVVVIASLS
jgi:hypothetical protein